MPLPESKLKNKQGSSFLSRGTVTQSQSYGLLSISNTKKKYSFVQPIAPSRLSKHKKKITHSEPDRQFSLSKTHTPCSFSQRKAPSSLSRRKDLPSHIRPSRNLSTLLTQKLLHARGEQRYETGVMQIGPDTFAGIPKYSLLLKSDNPNSCRAGRNVTFNSQQFTSSTLSFNGSPQNIVASSKAEVIFRYKNTSQLPYGGSNFLTGEYIFPDKHLFQFYSEDEIDQYARAESVAGPRVSGIVNIELLKSDSGELSLQLVEACAQVGVSNTIRQSPRIGKSCEGFIPGSELNFGLKTSVLQREDKSLIVSFAKLMHASAEVGTVCAREHFYKLGMTQGDELLFDHQGRQTLINSRDNFSATGLLKDGIHWLTKLSTPKPMLDEVQCFHLNPDGMVLNYLSKSAQKRWPSYEGYTHIQSREGQQDMTILNSHLVDLKLNHNWGPIKLFSPILSTVEFSASCVDGFLRPCILGSDIREDMKNAMQGVAFTGEERSTMQVPIAGRGFFSMWAKDYDSRSCAFEVIDNHDPNGFRKGISQLGKKHMERDPVTRKRIRFFALRALLVECLRDYVVKHDSLLNEQERHELEKLRAILLPNTYSLHRFLVSQSQGKGYDSDLNLILGSTDIIQKILDTDDKRQRFDENIEIILECHAAAEKAQEGYAYKIF